ncbi:amidohydrolase family protein [bacterium]
MTKKISRRKFVEKSIKGTAFLSLGGSHLLIQGCSRNKEYDLIISGGMVYDGLGNPGREMDLAIQGDKIILLSNYIAKEKAKRVIEAKGLAVCPGFLDAHSHTDIGLLANPKAESKIRQGVTTEISGNCGSSPFPIAGSVLEEYKKIAKDDYDVDVDWENIQGFFRRLEKRGMALNYGTLLGQGTLRGKVVGFNDRPPTEHDIQKMKAIIQENIKAGALGISSGLEYAPGSYAQTNEIIELCNEVARMNGVYATHMRDEGDKLLESLDEAIRVARKTGVSLQISHFKVAYPRNWSKIDAAIEKLDEAVQEGIQILADRYPYIAGSTGLSFYFPLWARQGTTAEFVGRLKNPDLDNKLRQHVKQQEKKLGSWDKVVICSVSLDKNKFLEGKNVLEGSREIQKEPYVFMRDLLIEEENRVGMIIFMMHEDNLKRILVHPQVVLGSDGSAVAPYGILFQGKPHPRFYGTFPRVLGKYVRDEKLFDLPKAIRKMTSLTASKFGLKDRGKIGKGFFADLVIFNPDTVKDSATWKEPHQYPSGIPYVIVNGNVVIDEGEHTGKLPGRILKKGRV